MNEDAVREGRRNSILMKPTPGRQKRLTQDKLLLSMQLEPFKALVEQWRTEGEQWDKSGLLVDKIEIQMAQACANELQAVIDKVLK